MTALSPPWAGVEFQVCGFDVPNADSQVYTVPARALSTRQRLARDGGGQHLRRHAPSRLQCIL